MLASAEALWGIGTGLLLTAFPLYMSELGATPASIGLVHAVGGAFAAAGMLPIGWLADRYGRRPLLIACEVCSTLGAASLIPLGDWRGAFVGMSLYWIGSAVLPVMSAHLAATASRGALGRTMGIVFGGFFAGTIIGGPLAGIAASELGLRAPVVGAVVMYAASTAVVTLVRASLPAATAQRGPFPRGLWVLLGVAPFAAAIGLLPGPLLPLYVRDVGSIPLQLVGIYAGLASLGAALGSVTSGGVADRLGTTAALATSAIAAVIGALLAAMVARSELALAVGVLLVGMNVANMAVAAALERILPSQRLTFGYAAFQLAIAAGFALSNALGGAFYEIHPALPLLVVAALALPMALVVAVVVGRVAPRMEPTLAA